MSAAPAFLPGERWIEYRRLRQPCPICGKLTRCKESPDGAVAMCFREERGAFKPASGSIAWLHRLKESRPLLLRPRIAPEPTRPALAPLPTRDAAIRALLPLLRQEQAVADDLARRGFGGDMARGLPAVPAERHREYLTLPGNPQQRKMLLENVRQAVGDDNSFASLGFVHYRSNRNARWPVFAGVPNSPDAGDVQIYAVVDAIGNYCALRAEIPTFEGRDKRWMSGGAGASVGSPAHVAVPVAAPLWADAGLTLANTVVLTEGEKKSDLAAAWLGYWTVSVPGVGNYNAAAALDIVLNQLPAAQAMVGRMMSPHYVVLAYDADFATNRAVQTQLAGLAAQATAAGLTVFFAVWPGAQGKGIDDYLWAVGRDAADVRLVAYVRDAAADDLVPVAPQRGTVQLSAATLAAMGQESQPTLSLAEAHSRSYDLVADTLARYLSSGGTDRRFVVNAATTGAGKTHATQQALADHLKAGGAGRIAVLVDTKAQLEAWVAPGSPLEVFHNAGKVALRKGRQSPALTVLGTPTQDDHECRQSQKTQAAGARRHVAAQVVCAGCPLAKANPTGWLCQKDGYLGAVARAHNAQIVVATKDAILNGSHEIDGFDMLIVDEGLREANLVETLHVRTDDIAVLRTRRAAHAVTEEMSSAAFETFYRLLSLCLSETAGGQYADMRETATEGWPLAALLARVADADGTNLARLLDECLRLKLGRKAQHASYGWERLDLNGVWQPGHTDNDHTAWPRRVTKDLLDVVQGGAGAWVVAEPGGGTHIEVRLLRTNIVAALRGEAVGSTAHLDGFARACDGAAPAVVVLDATPDVTLLELALGHAPEVLRLPVAEALRVTQINDNLYKGQRLVKHPDEVGRLVAAWQHQIARAEARDVVIFTEKALNPHIAQPQAQAHILLTAFQERMAAGGVRVRFSHFGLDNRASNAYQEADMLILVGHPQIPVAHAARLAATLRGENITTKYTKNHKGERGNNTGVENTSWPFVALCGENSSRVLRRYAGQAEARWRPCDPDAQVSALAYHSFAAEMVQTIGRGRAARRTSDRPLEVLLFCSEPVEGLPVADLTSLAGLVGYERLTENQRAALDAGRAARNAALQQTATARVLAVLDGQPGAPIQQVARAAGVAWDTAARAIDNRAHDRADDAATVFKARFDTGADIDILGSPVSKPVLNLRLLITSEPEIATQPPLFAELAGQTPRYKSLAAADRGRRRANRRS